MPFQKPRQAGRAPCFFWTPILGNFFISRKARQSRTARGANERFRNRRVGKLACQRVWFGSASLACPSAALRLSLYLTRSLPLISPFGLPSGSLPHTCPGAWLCISVSFDSLDPSRLALRAALRQFDSLVFPTSYSCGAAFWQSISAHPSSSIPERPPCRLGVVSNNFALALFLRDGHLRAPEFHGIFQTANSKTGVWTTFLGCVS